MLHDVIAGGQQNALRKPPADGATLFSSRVYVCVMTVLVCFLSLAQKSML